MKALIGSIASFMVLAGCTPPMVANGASTGPTPMVAGFTPTKFADKSPHILTAAFSGGCFWGLEYRFRDTPGVVGTSVGYTGGHTDSPTYEDVCTHTTGHAETVLLEYNPDKVTYRHLVDLFMNSYHNPTEMNRQGPDEGDSYRSAIWYANDDQKKDAEASIADMQKTIKDPIVTELKPLGKFWLAEDYHQNYIEKTGHFLCPIDPIIKTK